ncbi:restriction endonuclease [Sporosarcina sp. ZBG7A]|uniref:restriction endonuclease n=1 Tax=Sporosarcina sp. ZBG7A TaxID=1582223 RepID=UPI000579F691|nr:restriction endonuclease [Sporosarcina sp. ZBG7A]
MTVPGYQDFMYPFLEILSDGEEHTLQEMYVKLADHFSLDDQARELMLPSGNQLVLHNRIGWARTYLKKGELIRTVRRATFVITDKGKIVLADPAIDRIDNNFLMKYETFRAFKNPADSPKDVKPPNNIEEKTPRELLEDNYKLLKEETQDDLLAKVFECSPEFFERLVVKLFVAMGYGGSVEDAGKAMGKSGDEGIDGIIKEDPLGLDMIYVQAKRWKNTVHRPEIQKFVGSLEGFRAKKGIFITTSSFSTGAEEYIRYIDKKIILIDGSRLAELMFTYDVGVSHEQTYITKQIDLDFFDQ